MKSWMGNSYICDVMNKVLIIAIAAMCVVACGPRRNAKSQAAQKDAAQTETVEQPCCANHSEGTCQEEVNGKCAKEVVEEVIEAGHKAEKEVKESAQKECEKVEGIKVEQIGRKADPKPIKPVPKPKK